MIEKKQVYKCLKCGNIVESLWNGKPSISCCGETMTKLEANTVDASNEKHIPTVERKGNTVTVKVGEVAHPMVAEHYILFIEVIVGNKVYRYDFVEGDTTANATFEINENEKISEVRAYCNIHGLWSMK